MMYSYLQAVVAYEETVNAATYASCCAGSLNLAAWSRMDEYS